MHTKYKKILWDIEIFFENFWKENKIQKKNIFIKDFQRESFWITENIGNNSFSYYSHKKIFVPSIKNGDIQNIQLGKNIVFIDDEKQEIGLEQFIYGETHTTSTPIFICDNHNFVLEVWEQFQKNKYTLVHIDQHRDNMPFLGDENNWRKSAKICDYIDFAIQKEWIQPLYYSFIEKNDLLQRQKNESEQYILNIDLDFFTPEHTLLSLEEKLELILFYLPQTEIITLATSPLFIDQEFAIEIGKLFWKYL